MAAEEEVLSSGSAESESGDDFPAVEKKLSKERKHGPSAKVRTKDEWRRRFCFSSYRDYLLHLRSVGDKQTAKDDSSTQRGKAERDENYGLYADDKGYLQGEIYGDAESDEEVGFAGDLSQELNLMPSSPDNLIDKERTLQDAEPEIFVVSSQRFVREISQGKQK